MTPNPQPGEYWRDRNGDVYGPLKVCDETPYSLQEGDDGNCYMENGQFFSDRQSDRDLITRVYVTDWPDGAVEVAMTGDETYVDLRGDNLDTHTLRGLLIPISKPLMTDAEKLAIAIEALRGNLSRRQAMEVLAKIGGAE